MRPIPTFREIFARITHAKKGGLRPPPVLLLEASDLLVVHHPLHVPAGAAHPRELDRLQMAPPDQPGYRIRADPQFTGNFFPASQHIPFSFLPLPFREVLKSRRRVPARQSTFAPSLLPYRQEVVYCTHFKCDDSSTRVNPRAVRLENGVGRAADCYNHNLPNALAIRRRPRACPPSDDGHFSPWRHPCPSSRLPSEFKCRPIDFLLIHLYSLSLNFWRGEAFPWLPRPTPFSATGPH